MIVNLKEILSHASERNYAVGAFNVFNLEFTKAIISGAEEKNSPVILQIYEGQLHYIAMEEFGPLVRQYAENSKIPVCLHLDHGLSMKPVVRAIKSGFSSVMIDCSALPLAENILQTRKIVETAHSVGVSVEAELGRIGSASSTEEHSSAFYTKPDEAGIFCRETGVDALAVSIGSMHGIYKREPEFDYARLVEINSRTNIPLVLHGGSGTPEKDFKKLTANGINKINIYSALALSATNAIREKLTRNPDFIQLPELIVSTGGVFKKAVMEYIDIFGSADKTNHD